THRRLAPPRRRRNAPSIRSYPLPVQRPPHPRRRRPRRAPLWRSRRPHDHPRPRYDAPSRPHGETRPRPPLPYLHRSPRRPRPSHPRSRHPTSLPRKTSSRRHPRSPRPPRRRQTRTAHSPPRRDPNPNGTGHIYIVVATDIVRRFL
ncbi:hypothetical protein C9890_0603, partial [Perkinsus sp. BL_2016]